MSDRSVVLSVEPWSFESIPGRVIRTAGYRVFTTAPESELVRRLPRFLESALDQYTSALAPLPRPSLRLDTYLLANRWQWARMTQRMLGTRSGDYMAIDRGGFTVSGRAVLYDIGDGDTLSLAAHEGWHQYTQRTFRDPIPPWLEEGVATYMEGHLAGAAGLVEFRPWANAERYDQLRAAARDGRLLPLDDLLVVNPKDLVGTDPQAALAFYAQVWALVHWLREADRGRRAAPLAELLQDAAAGRLSDSVASRLGATGRAAASDAIARTGPAVFEAYFGADGAAESYAAFIEHVTRAGMLDRITAGESPVP